MKEYLVEILDEVQTNYIYAFVIAESKKQARNKDIQLKEDAYSFWFGHVQCFDEDDVYFI